eukprot:11850316-Prorocentrum_lima.AAC.1
MGNVLVNFLLIWTWGKEVGLLTEADDADVTGEENVLSYEYHNEDEHVSDDADDKVDKTFP